MLVTLQLWNTQKINTMAEYKIPKSWLDASEKERSDIANGCGAGGWKFDIVPDTIYGLDISDVCNWHDFEYTFRRKDEVNKNLADLNFYHNLLVRVERKGGLLKWFRKRRALKYYLAVKHFGDSAFYD